jgi:hypothetical protein
VSEARPARPRAVQAARDAAKRCIRRGAVATAPARVLPDFLIVGAKRGGTTSLWRYLLEHPGILPLFPTPERLKGLYYFDEHYGMGERWYRSHFPTRAALRRRHRTTGHPVACGEASPYYLYHPLAPGRAAATVPGARVVVLLRDPVDRAFSHWKERCQHTETLPFEAAIEAEGARTAGEADRILADPTYVSFAHRHQSYVDQGRYAPMLDRWIAAFGRERVLVGISEEMYADPQSSYDRVTDHLGLARHRLRDAAAHNAEAAPEMSPELRRRLAELFRPDVDAVAALLGRPLPWLSLEATSSALDKEAPQP